MNLENKCLSKGYTISKLRGSIYSNIEFAAFKGNLVILFLHERSKNISMWEKYYRDVHPNHRLYTKLLTDMEKEQYVNK